MSRSTVFIVLFVSLSACGGKDASPTLPSDTVFSLSGTVYGSDGTVLGASVTNIGGIHTGQAQTTDDTGRFSFTDLTPSSFTLQVAKPTDGYVTQNRAVNLTANQVMTIYLSDH
jgi:hypothetical protein